MQNKEILVVINYAPLHPEYKCIYYVDHTYEEVLDDRGGPGGASHGKWKIDDDHRLYFWADDWCSPQWMLDKSGEKVINHLIEQELLGDREDKC